MAEPLTEAEKVLLSAHADCEGRRDAVRLMSRSLNAQAATIARLDEALGDAIVVRERAAIEAQAVEAWLQAPEAEERVARALHAIHRGPRPWLGVSSEQFAQSILFELRDSTPTP
jgi:hypothetical protein